MFPIEKTPPTMSAFAKYKEEYETLYALEVGYRTTFPHSRQKCWAILQAYYRNAENKVKKFKVKSIDQNNCYVGRIA